MSNLENTILKHNVPNPDVDAGSFMAPGGSTLHWFNDSDYPKFEIRFAGTSPVEEGNNIVGTKDHPAVLHVSGPDGTYLYTIHYAGDSGKKCKWSPVNIFIVGHCVFCGG
jgi:hypothetical protein